jgi:hypothetical protein
MFLLGLGAVALFLGLVAWLQEHFRALAGHFFDLVLFLLAVVSGQLEELRGFLRDHLRKTADTAAEQTASLVVKAIITIGATVCVVVLAGADIDVTRQTVEALGLGFLGTVVAVGLIVAILGIGICLMETHDIHNFGLFAGASEPGRKLVHRAAGAFLLLAVAAQVAMGDWRADVLSAGGGPSTKYPAELLVNVGLPLLLTGVALLLGWALPWLAIFVGLACLGLAVVLVTLLLTVVTVIAGLVEHIRRIIFAVIDLIAHLGSRIWPGSARTMTVGGESSPAPMAHGVPPELGDPPARENGDPGSHTGEPEGVSGAVLADDTRSGGAGAEIPGQMAAPIFMTDSRPYVSSLQFPSDAGSEPEALGTDETCIHRSGQTDRTQS